MGTNYYAIKNLSRKDKARVKDLIDHDQYEEAREALPREIHLCKFSWGWKTLWDHNLFKHFQPNEESIRDFILSHKLVDEYGDELADNEEWLRIALERPGITAADDLPSDIFDARSREDAVRKVYPEVQFDKGHEFHIGPFRFPCFEDFS